MDNNNVALIIVAVVANLPTAIALFRDWRKIQAEKRGEDVSAEAKISEMALGLLEPYRNRVQEFQDEIEKLEKKLTTLQCFVDSLEGKFEKVKKGAWVLHDQLVEHGQAPKYTPPQNGEKKE